MWGLTIVVGLVGIGLTLWDLATRPSVPQRVPMGTGNPNAAARTPLSPPAAASPMSKPAELAPPHPSSLNTKALQQRATYCQLQVTDWQITSVWVNERVPVNANFPMLVGLKMLYNAAPSAWNTWPEPVRRVFCTYLATS